METKLNSRWAHICPKCGESTYTECIGEDRIYSGEKAEVKEYYHCSKCNLDFAIISEMVYKHHIV